MFTAENEDVLVVFQSLCEQYPRENPVALWEMAGGQVAAEQGSQPKYAFKYASASFIMTIMDVIRQRGITIRNVGPETAEFLRKLTNAANGGERLQEMIAALDPYYESYQGDIYCFFCSALNNDEHRDDCAWKIAKRNVLHGFLP